MKNEKSTVMRYSAIMGMVAGFVSGWQVHKELQDLGHDIADEELPPEERVRALVGEWIEESVLEDISAQEYATWVDEAMDLAYRNKI